MNKQNFTLLLLTTCGFMPQAFSAAHFFKRLALGAYKTRSVLTGAGLTGFYGYQLYSHDQKWQEEHFSIKEFCESSYPEEQEEFRAKLKSIIPQSDF